MKSVYITTIVGEDSPQLIKSMAETTRSMGGEWLKSKVMKLDRQFAAMMKVTIEDGKEESLKAELEKTYPDLQFTYAPARTEDAEHVDTVSLTVDCEDRPGLTHDITKVLSDLNLHTENLEFHRLPVTPMGGTVYSAKMDVMLPESMSKEDLSDNLEAVSDCIRVNFD